MKKNLLFVATLIFVVNVAYAQSSNIIVSGGWVTASPDDSDNSVDGFKIGGQYEYVMGYNNWALGGSLTYLGFKETGGLVTTKYHSWPINFYGKYRIGKNKIQGYLKGVAGIQFFKAKVEGQSGGDAKTNDFGFSFGTGAGVNYSVSEKVFINLDYEFLYLTNAFYNNAITNAVAIGVGFKLN